MSAFELFTCECSNVTPTQVYILQVFTRHIFQFISQLLRKTTDLSVVSCVLLVLLHFLSSQVNHLHLITAFQKVTGVFFYTVHTHILGLDNETEKLANLVMVANLY